MENLRFETYILSNIVIKNIVETKKLAIDFFFKFRFNKSASIKLLILMHLQTMCVCFQI